MSMEEPLRARIEALLRANSVRRKKAAAQLEEEIRRREELLRQTFRRYVSPRVADKILEDSELRDTLLEALNEVVRAHGTAEWQVGFAGGSLVELIALNPMLLVGDSVMAPVAAQVHHR